MDLEKINEYIEYFKPFKILIQVIAPILTIIVALIIPIFKQISVEISISIIAISLYAFISAILIFINKAKKKPFGYSAFVFSYKTRKNSRILLNSLTVVLLFFISTQGWCYLNKQNKQINPNIIVLTSKFTESGKDNFSYILSQDLRKELEHNDTILVNYLDEFIKVNGENIIDSLNNIFVQNRCNKGILTYGIRDKDEQIFDCSLYLNNLKNINPSFKNLPQNINIRTPNLLTFSIYEQSNVVKSFILALVGYFEFDYKKSIDLFKQAKKLNTNSPNKTFESYCNFFIGNINLKQKNIEQAISYYKQTQLPGNDHAYVLYNLGISNLIKKDTVEAQTHFKEAHDLNNKIKNPLNIKEKKLPEFKPKIKEKPTVAKQKKKKQEIKADSSQTTKDTSKNKLNKESIDDNIDIQFRFFLARGKYGILYGRDTLIKPSLDTIQEFNINKKKFYVVKKDKKWGILDEKMNFRIAVKHKSRMTAIDAIFISEGNRKLKARKAKNNDDNWKY